MNFLAACFEIIADRVVVPRLTLMAVLATCLFGQTHAAADLGKAVAAADLDPANCYRVRDLEIVQEDVRFYLTAGYLIFGKPVNGAPITAVFSADTEDGDAEVLLLPPNRAERRSLAGYTGSPTLDEHFTNAVFLFTEPQARGLAEQIRAKGEAKSSPETGALMKDQWSRVVADLTGSFESLFVLDLISGPPPGRGFFEAIIQGKTLGNFDIGIGGRAPEQVRAGQLKTRDSRDYFDTWTSFVSQSQRASAPAPPEEEILSYRTEATLDAALVLHCVTRIHVRTTADSRLVLPFDLSSQMRPTAAKVDGAPAEVYERDPLRETAVQRAENELVLVIPPQPLAPGSEHEIEIRHEGKVVVDAGHQVYFVGARGSWYPGRGSQFSTYDVTYRYPKNLDLVSAGQVTEDRTEDDMRITRRVTSSRLRTLGFNLGVYQRKSLERGATQIEVFANSEVEDALRDRPAEPPPPAPHPPVIPNPRRPASTVTSIDIPVPQVVNPASQLTRVADDIAAAFDFYRTRFGEPPINRLEVSPVPGRFGQGFGGMIYLSTLSYLPVSARPLSQMPEWQQLFFGEFLRAHEVAHQWWGNIVTTDNYRHEWLMESLANYSALMFMESRDGPRTMTGMLDEYRRQLMTKGPDGRIAEAEGPVVEGRRLENSNNPNAWSAVAYGKGSWIIHMLRQRMGDAAFVKMLAELRRRYEWKTVDTEEFRLLCAEFLPPHSADPKLENFFDQWVYGTGIPALKLTYSVKGKPGAWKLTGTITQSDVPDNFSANVPVEIQTGLGKKTVRLVETGADPATFSVPVAAANAKAVLDPAGTILRR